MHKRRPRLYVSLVMALAVPAALALPATAQPGICLPGPAERDATLWPSALASSGQTVPYAAH